jgi:two-component sensor histidine kinase
MAQRLGRCASPRAVNEAASNIMKHAYHGRSDQRIQLDAEAFADCVSAEGDEALESDQLMNHVGVCQRLPDRGRRVVG